MKQYAITANLLADGRVAFLTWDGDWSDNVADSHVTTSDEESEWLLETAQQAVVAQVVIDPYLIEVSQQENATRPILRREQIRAEGPTKSINYAPVDKLDALPKVA